MRQPLARVVVVAPREGLAALREFEQDLLEELNVEALETVETPEAIPADLPRGAEGDVVVALDATLTPELRRKGLARQLVHQVQRLRKGAGLSVDDRIRLAVSVDAERRSALAENADYIQGETLAIELVLGAPPDGWTASDVRLDGGPAVVAITRAGDGSAARAAPASGGASPAGGR